MAVSTILVVDDDPQIRRVLRTALIEHGYEATDARNGEEAIERLREEKPSLIILDMNMPGMNGLETCRTIRSTSNIPIIMLTVRDSEADKIAALDAGADDYVTKPFSPGELNARIAALLRRTLRASTPAMTLRYGPLVIDVDRHVVRVDGTEVRLTAKEFLLMQYLIEHRGRVLSRDLLLTDVWGYQYTGGTRTVDVHIRRLREKIPALAEAIVTVKQFGYRLEDRP